MGVLSGRRLTALGAALIALAGAAAVRVAVSGALPGAGPKAEARGTSAAAGTGAALSAGDHVALAASAEARGDVAAALAHYRTAVARDPRCVDRRSPRYLGETFEEKLKGWIAGMRSGRIPGGPAALSDASFIFRRLYGGCG